MAREGSPGRETKEALRVRAMSAKVTSIGEMYVVLERADQARTWPQTRPVDLSKTHAPESPGAEGEWDVSFFFCSCRLSSLLNTVLVGWS